MRMLTASTAFVALATVAVPVMAEESFQFLALKNVSVHDQQMQNKDIQTDTKLVQLTDTELSSVEGADNICVVCANANVQAQILTNKSTQQTGNQTNQRGSFGP
jgi:hypothetical protein